MVLCNGVLYFLRDPADPNYNPFRDIIDGHLAKDCVERADEARQERTNGRCGDNDTLNYADKMVIEEVDINKISEDELKLTYVDYLTGNPLPNDIVTLIPVCAPYTALQSYQYSQDNPWNNKKGKDASIWYLDNDGSNHMTGTKSHFRDIDESVTRRAEAVKHVNYILNMVPTRALVDKTPYEAIYNRKLNLENLRIFGCTAYAKITIPHLKKLDDRSIPIIYLGVEEGSKACRLYDPKGKRKHVSKDVRFMETKMWDWDNNKKEISTQDTFWASFVVEGVDNEKPTPVNTENNDNTYQEHEPITDHDLSITPPAYTYDLNSEEEEEATIIETQTLLFMEEELRNYKEASTDKKWIEAMEIEFDSMNKNNTWNLTTLPTNQKAIGLKWVFKTKRDAKGKIIKYKVRLVAKGYVQEQGIDFDEVFAPVAQIEIVHLILALAAYHGWQVHHLDVKSAFLHGDLKEEVYVTQLEGFI
nr:zinc finger, CCHC-type [Tanacetum cinerariifolium]